MWRCLWAGERLSGPAGNTHLPLSSAKAPLALGIVHILERRNFIIFFYGLLLLKKRWQPVKFFIYGVVFRIGAANTSKVGFMKVEPILRCYPRSSKCYSDGDIRSAAANDILVVFCFCPQWTLSRNC